MLGHDEVRPERRSELRDQRADRLQPRPFAGGGLQGNVDGRAGGETVAQLPHPASARKEVAPGLMDGQRQDPRIRPMDGLHAIAVVHVEVDIQDPQAVPAGPGDGKGRVVVDAEPRGPIGHRVMQPAARVEGVLDVPAQDRLQRADGAPGYRRGRLVHAGERRVITALADAGLRQTERVGREALDRLDVAPGMAPQQLVIGRRLRRQTGLGAHRAQQLDPRPEPAWRERMVRPEVIGRGSRPVHQEHAWHDTGHGTCLQHASARQAGHPAGDARRAHRHR